MAVVICRSCGRYNLAEELSERGFTCEMCGQAVPVGDSPPLPEKRGQEVPETRVQNSPPAPSRPPEQVVEAIYHFAAEQMRNGLAPDAIENRLIEQGLDAEAANVVIGNLKQAKAKALKEAGRTNMLYGALWCIGGIVVTAVTYLAAAGAGGGTYIVAWGAIVYGAIQFFRGMMQASGE